MHRGKRIDFKIILFRQFCNGFDSSFMIENKTAARFIAKNNISVYGQRWNEHEVLMNHSDSSFHCVARGFDDDRLTVEGKRSCSWTIKTINAFYYGRFSGAVFAYEGMNCSAGDFKREIVYGLEFPKGFSEAGNRQRRHSLSLQFGWEVFFKQLYCSMI